MQYLFVLFSGMTVCVCCILYAGTLDMSTHFSMLMSEKIKSHIYSDFYPYSKWNLVYGDPTLTLYTNTLQHSLCSLNATYTVFGFIHTHTHTKERSDRHCHSGQSHMDNSVSFATQFYTPDAQIPVFNEITGHLDM